MRNRNELWDVRTTKASKKEYMDIKKERKKERKKKRKKIIKNGH